MRIAIRVWDLPTRLFHWALAGCLVGAIGSAAIGGEALAWHFRFGFAILALLLFRFTWGFLGPLHARFARFPPSPSAALRQLRGAPPPRAGHSPLGALSVYAMLLALAVQAGTGLFANDSIAWDGPLRNLVSNDTSDLLTRIHKVNRVIVIALVLLHLCAIAWYVRVRRRPLLREMITGDRVLDDDEGAPPTPSEDGTKQRLAAAALLAAAATVVWGLVSAVG